jgi:hypothetical protein
MNFVKIIYNVKNVIKKVCYVNIIKLNIDVHFVEEIACVKNMVKEKILVIYAIYVFMKNIKYIVKFVMVQHSVNTIYVNKIVKYAEDQLIVFMIE